jgi:predicted ATPase
MITNISISNFRAFQSAITVRIRPITILIGKNSAGKSSLIKFLLMLRQTLESQSDQFFVTNGKHVQLGTWKDLRHTNTRERRCWDSSLRFSIDVLTDDLPSAEIQAMWQAASRKRMITTDGNKLRLQLEIEKQPVKRESQKVKFRIRGGVHYGNRFKYGRHEVYGRLNPFALFRKYGANNLDRVGFLRFERTDSLNDLIESVAAERFLDTLRHEFLSQRHLSPIREESQLAVQTGSPPPNDVGDRGEYAMPHLADFFTNTEMHDKAAFVQKFAQIVGGIDDLTFKSKLTKILTHIKGRNVDTQAVVSLADFGFGVSQCLPIFVQGAMHQRGQLLIVEQPESQLHSTAQLELGSFFAELWKERGVPSLVETHSPNIILRLRKLVKEGKLLPDDISIAYFTVEQRWRNTIDAMRDEFFYDVASNANQKGKGFRAVSVKNLNINADGSLEKGLPMEFFGADLIEALEMGAVK